jgi:hypothetical protein
MDQNTAANNWRQRGFSCEPWVDPPGQRWEDFVHAVDELMMVLEGDVEFEIDGVIHHPRRRIALRTQPGQNHRALAVRIWQTLILCTGW